MAKTNKQEERRRKKMFFMIFMILFVGIVLTASTYAWFTTNSSVTVQSLDVNVSTSEGLQISTDAQNWTSVVRVEDITSAAWTGVTNQVPTTNLNPVSTIGEVADGRMKMFLGSVETDEADGKNKLTTTAEADKNGTDGNYIAFDLFFRSTEAKQLYLAEGSKVTYRSGPEGIENAARVAFINLGSVDYSAEPSVAQAKLENGTPWIWEPNFDTHRPSARMNGINVYKMEASDFTGNDTDGYTSAKLAYKGVKAPTTTPLVLDSTDANVFGDVTTNETPKSGITEAAYKQAFNIAAGITKIRIYMWIEGQDIDCEDLASSGNITFDLQFSIKENANAAA